MEPMKLEHDGAAASAAPMEMGHGGMEHSGMDHGAMGQMDMGDLKRRFWICLVLALPVLVLNSHMFMMLTGRYVSFPGSYWLVLVLSTVLYFYGGQPFLKGALGELRSHKPAMMTLVTLGLSVSYFYSLYAFIMNQLVMAAQGITSLPDGSVEGYMGLLTGSTMPYMDFFMELAMLVVIMLLGHWVEMRALGGAGDALRGLAALLPGSAALLGPDGTTREVPLAQLAAGSRVLVRAGQSIPADGLVVAGSGGVNEAMVTGEARLVAKKPGDKVIGGAVNGDGTLTVEVTATGESGYLAQVAKLVAGAQSQKSQAETMGDKVAGWLFYAAVIAGALAFIVWLLAGAGLSTALTRLVTVLVIACPHALGLAIPLVVARCTSIGAKNGLLLRNRQALEAAPRVQVVAMDKTGTLTEGRFKVRQVLSLREGLSENEVLAMMAALEQGSSHPLAAGVLAEAQLRGLAPAAARDIHTLPGAGLSGTLPDGQKAVLASAAWLDEQHIPYDRARWEQLAGQGSSVSFLVLDGAAAGLLAQGDEVKPDADLLVARLEQEGVTPVMLTGDNEASARAVAGRLGIEAVHAALRPGDKQRLVQQLQQDGKRVMMVGDGVNDAPALAAAEVGVAIGAGTDVAIDSADVVLVHSEPADILRLLQLARATSRKMKQNLFWGAGYNVVAIPLAAGVLAPFGFVLGPAAGAVLMSLSTVIVALNALTLHLPARPGD